jgi:ADP-heptose:LPS heptosyltransferase
MPSIYLPIRALGDFIITASVIKNNFRTKVPVVLPSYLLEFYNAINGDDYFELVGTINYDTQPAFFELYKVKDLQNLKRLASNMLTISSFVNKKHKYILDYSSRRLRFTGANFVWPSTKGNIYEEKFKLFRDENFLNGADPRIDIIEPVEPGKLSNILILPDSRVSSKDINENLVGLITGEFKGINIRTAYFSKKKNIKENSLSYSNFEELINLISNCDIIISAESLPYHLANYLNKPHFVIYNQSRHFKLEFATPFMLKNNYYSIFTGNNAKQVAETVYKTLCN